MVPCPLSPYILQASRFPGFMKRVSPNNFMTIFFLSVGNVVGFAQDFGLFAESATHASRPREAVPSNEKYVMIPCDDNHEYCLVFFSAC